MNYGLPSTPVVRLYATEPAAGGEIICALDSYFRKAGYEVESLLDAGIEELRTLPHDCSVFFFNTHGCESTQNRTSVLMGLQTGTLDIGDPRYAAEKDEGLIFSASVREPGGTVEREYLFITYKFIQKYWRFSENSFVFINACYAMDEGPDCNSIYRTILESCNASVCGGWTAGNDSLCDLSNRYLFDRLLGTNAEGYRARPPNRPFDLDSVLKAMKRMGKNQRLVTDPHTQTTKPTSLQIKRSTRGDFGILAPSVANAACDNETSVYLFGCFGSDPSKLRVFVRETRESMDGTSGLELIQDCESDPWNLTCHGLPRSGRGSGGYIVVAADYGNGHLVESNAVPLTTWKGQFTYTLRLPGQESGTGIGQITCNAFLRGDIHHWREEPDGPLTTCGCAFFGVQDEANCANYTSSGTYKDGEGTTYTWHGSGRAETAICGMHRFEPDPTLPKLCVLMVANGTMIDIKHADERAGDGTSQCELHTQLLTPQFSASPEDDFLHGSLTWEDGKLYEPCYDIPARAVASLINYLPLPERIVTAELKWETLKAEYAPDDETPA